MIYYHICPRQVLVIEKGAQSQVEVSLRQENQNLRRRHPDESI